MEICDLYSVAKHIVSNTLSLLFLDVTVKSVKHTVLVRNILWIGLFVS